MMSDAETPTIGQLIEIASAGKMEIIQVISTSEGLIASNRRHDAISLYRAWLKKPTPGVEYAAYFNLGVLLADTGSQSEAEAAYRQAVYQKKEFPQAQYNLGVQLEKQGRLQEAIDQWHIALDLQCLQEPEHQDIHRYFLNGLGRLYDKFHRYEEAEEMLRRSLALNPSQSDVLYHWLHLRQRQCKWPVMRTLPEISAEAMWDAASPLAILGMTDDPARLLKTSNSYIAKNVISSHRMVAQGHNYGHQKIRIGFVSGDFCLHAVSLLTVRLYELLDRRRFDVYGFGWGRDDTTPFRQRVLKSFDHFFEISGLTDTAAADLIHQHEIDVVVDLQGLTSGARPNIIAHGAAPWQIGYLGYPGTSGIPHVDYVIADEFIFPPEMAPFFTEKPLYLRDCFQASDDLRTQTVVKDPAKYGLPPEKFVYCAFNNNYKITPEVFGSWMRILHAVPDSILWLLSDNTWAEANMRSAAQAYGVDPGRLHFAGRVAPEDYLSRFGAAKLFLDTFPYNAGTTANDALWAGLPIVTLSGRSYVSRMAGSLLCSVGLSQLIASTSDEYEAKAIAFANDPALQTHSEQQLRAAKLNSAALNTGKLAEDFGSAVEKLVR